MDALWGAVIVLLSLPCWAGQLMSWLWPATAERLQLTEAADSVEPAFHADVRGEAVWDVLTLWTLPLAGVLLISGVDAWAFWGLVGGGMYVYFAGRGIFTRRAMQRRGLRVGEPAFVRTAFIGLALWGVLGLVVIAFAADALVAA